MTLPLYYRGIPEQSATSGPKREISSTPTLKRGVPFSKGSKYPDEVIERERAVELPYMVKIAFKVPIPSTTSICMCGAIKTDTIPSSFIHKWRRNRPHPLEKCENFYRSPFPLKLCLCPCMCYFPTPPCTKRGNQGHTEDRARRRREAATDKKTSFQCGCPRGAGVFAGLKRERDKARARPLCGHHHRHSPPTP